MGYYVRVLSTSADCVPFNHLESALVDEGLDAKLSIVVSDDNKWEQVLLSHPDGREIALLDRNPVEPDSLGTEELAEFSDEVADCKPASAARWLLDYFTRVRCIYAFQVLSGTEQANGWEILDAIKSRVWSFAPGILQADHEGFSNEAGYHIVWQFDDSVEATWAMGVLRENDWVHFQMELGNPEHRAAFARGEVPAGVQIV